MACLLTTPKKEIKNFQKTPLMITNTNNNIGRSYGPDVLPQWAHLACDSSGEKGNCHDGRICNTCQEEEEDDDDDYDNDDDDFEYSYGNNTLIQSRSVSPVSAVDTGQRFRTRRLYGVSDDNDGTVTTSCEDTQEMTSSSEENSTLNMNIGERTKRMVLMPSTYLKGSSNVLIRAAGTSNASIGIVPKNHNGIDINGNITNHVTLETQHTPSSTKTTGPENRPMNVVAHFETHTPFSTKTTGPENRPMNVVAHFETHTPFSTKTTGPENRPLNVVAHFETPIRKTGRFMKLSQTLTGRSASFLSLVRHHRLGELAAGVKKNDSNGDRSRSSVYGGKRTLQSLVDKCNMMDECWYYHHRNKMCEADGGGSGSGGGGGWDGGGGGEQSSESSSSDSVTSLSLLCADRVSQMTKTYNDIEAVSRLLEEKERDLELAARIGQTLLSKNKELSSKNESLDEQLALANDKVNQLRHDLSLKEELLRFFNEDLEDDPGENTSPAEPSDESLVNMDFLNKKVNTLENENLNLRLESANLKSTTASYEDKEKRLVEDCIKQLAEVNCQVETFAEELQYKAVENEGQKEQICKFLTQTADLQVKIRKLTVDNMDLHDKLTTSTDSQRKLTKELGKMQDKYDELYEMLEDAQVELQVMSSRHNRTPRGTDSHHHNASNLPTDSLASELETSLQQELAESTRRAQSWKIFETAKAAKRAVAKVTNSTGHRHQHQHHQHHHHHHHQQHLHHSLGSSCSAVSMTSSSARSLPPPPHNTSAPAYGLRHRHDSDAVSSTYGYSAYTSDGESMTSDGYTADMDSLYGSNQELGRPGIPGSNDLESALRRLLLRKEKNEREVELEEASRRIGRGRSNSSSNSGPLTPQPPHSPGGLSTSSSYLNLSIPGSYNSPCHNSPAMATLKTSDKLKIMKPLEGSVTLRHWQHLATPNLGGIFESRDGVQMKGERKLEMGEEVVYCLSDFEEDEGRPKENTASTLVHSLIDASVMSPKVSRNWDGLQDPRTPSPGLAYYNHPSHPTFNSKPMQTSTPVLNSSNPLSSHTNNGNDSNSTRFDGHADTTNTSMSDGGDGISLGLAALLDSHQNTRPGPSSLGLRDSIMRAAVPISKKALSTYSSSSSSSSAASSSGSKQKHFNNSSNLSFSSTSMRNQFQFPRSNGAAISSGDNNSGVFTSTPRLCSRGGGSILMTTQNLLQRYKSVPGSRSLEEMSAAVAAGSSNNNNTSAVTSGVKVTGTNSSLSSLVSTSQSLSSFPITSTTSQSSSSSLTSTSTSSEDKNSWVFSPDMTGQGFIQQLKNRGFSLYGLWANATATAAAKISTEAPSSSSSSSSATATNISSTVDGSKADNNAINSNGHRTKMGLNFMASLGSKASSALADAEAEELLNSPTAATTTAITTTTGSGSGVFGTYSGFGRGGML